MSHDNRLWGTERIRGGLLKLGIVVSKRSIRRYRWRRPTFAGSQRWQAFLSNQLKGIWVADLLVVHTVGGWGITPLQAGVSHVAVADDQVIATGRSVARCRADGRFAEVTAFWLSAPPGIPTSVVDPGS
jgi:hypothetical protein